MHGGLCLTGLREFFFFESILEYLYIYSLKGLSTSEQRTMSLFTTYNCMYELRCSFAQAREGDICAQNRWMATCNNGPRN